MRETRRSSLVTPWRRLTSSGMHSWPMSCRLLSCFTARLRMANTMRSSSRFRVASVRNVGSCAADAKVRRAGPRRAAGGKGGAHHEEVHQGVDGDRVLLHGGTQSLVHALSVPEGIRNLVTQLRVGGEVAAGAGGREGGGGGCNQRVGRRRRRRGDAPNDADRLNEHGHAHVFGGNRRALEEAEERRDRACRAGRGVRGCAGSERPPQTQRTVGGHVLAVVLRVAPAQVVQQRRSVTHDVHVRVPQELGWRTPTAGVGIHCARGVG